MTITYIMDHTGITLHMNTQHCTKNWTILKENVKKIMNKSSVKTGHQEAGPLITERKTRTVVLGQDMEELYKNQIG